MRARRIPGSPGWYLPPWPQSWWRNLVARSKQGSDDQLRKDVLADKVKFR